MKMLLTLALSVFASASMAAAYGVAGCGLGSVLIGDKPGAVQIVVATLNGTSGNQTFGITTGTSNCGAGVKSLSVYIEANKVQLANDISRGQGEALNGLANIYGINNVDAVGTALQPQFKNIFATQDVAQIQNQIENTLKASELL